MTNKKHEVLNHDRETEAMIAKALSLSRGAKFAVLSLLLLASLVPQPVVQASYYTWTTLTIGAGGDDVSTRAYDGNLDFYTDLNGLTVRQSAYVPAVYLRFEGLSGVTATDVIDEMILSVYAGPSFGANYSESTFDGGLVSFLMPDFSHNFELTEAEITSRSWSHTSQTFDGDDLYTSGQWVNFTVRTSDPRTNPYLNNFNDSVIIGLQSWNLDAPDYPYFRQFRSFEEGNPCKLYVKHHDSTLPEDIYDADPTAWFVETYQGFDIYAYGTVYQRFTEWVETDTPGKGTLPAVDETLITNWVTGDGGIYWQNTKSYPGDVEVTGAFSFTYTNHVNTNYIHGFFTFSDAGGWTWGLKARESTAGIYDIALFENNGGEGATIFSGVTEGTTYYFHAIEDLAGDDLYCNFYATLSDLNARTNPIRTMSILNTYMGADTKQWLRVNRPLLVGQAHTQTCTVKWLNVTMSPPDDDQGFTYLIIDPDDALVSQNTTSLQGARVIIQGLLGSGSYDSFLDLYFMDFLGLGGMLAMVLCWPIGIEAIKRKDYTGGVGVIFVGMLFGYGLFITWLVT